MGMRAKGGLDCGHYIDLSPWGYREVIFKISSVLGIGTEFHRIP
jgi:hypothetical protein